MQWQLADVATDLAAGEALVERTARRMSAGESVTVDAAHAKKFVTRAARQRIGDCMQAMGAEGLRSDHPLARHYAAAKIAEYLDGTTEIQNVVISRALLREARS